MFMKLKKLTSLATIPLLISNSASAHQGSHDSLTTPELLNHLITSPLHLVIYAALTIVIAVVVHRLRTHSDHSREVFHE